MTLASSGEHKGQGQLRAPLTNREWDIVRLIADDMSNQQIAEHLFISVKTVESHVTSILTKLDISSRAAVARYGWITRSARLDHLPDLKPNPLAAQTVAELEHLLRQYWIWSGRPPCRTIADRSGLVFSHTTISKLLYDRPGKPPLKLHYVQGLVRGCEGDPLDQELWATAWRRVHLRAGA